MTEHFLHARVMILFMPYLIENSIHPRALEIGEKQGQHNQYIIELRSEIKAIG